MLPSPRPGTLLPVIPNTEKAKKNMKRWLLVCLLAVLAVVLVTDYHSQEEGTPVSQQQDCRYQIIAPAATNATTLPAQPLHRRHLEV